MHSVCSAANKILSSVLWQKPKLWSVQEQNYHSLVSSLPLQGYFGQITHFLYLLNQKMNIIMTEVSSSKDAHLKSIQQQKQY
jgi:hypothetical protein